MSKKFLLAMLAAAFSLHAQTPSQSEAHRPAWAFLAPDKQEVLFRINMSECGLLSFKINPSTANSNEIKRARFEMFVGEMKLDGKIGRAHV